MEAVWIWVDFALKLPGFVLNKTEIKFLKNDNAKDEKVFR